MAGATTGVALLWLMKFPALSVASIWVYLVTLALPALMSAAAVNRWAARQARTLLGAVDVANSALVGLSAQRTMNTAANESELIANAVRGLVDRAERSTRELSQRQAYAAIGDFAVELARELAPSVARARSDIRTLESNLHLDSPLRAPLSRAQRELHRLANTLQDSLRLARSGQLAAHRVDLWQPVRAALRTASADATARGIWLEPPAHGGAPLWIHGDQDALEQLFLNLLLNGIQATESGGRVELKVSLSDDVIVTITDSGCGIPDGTLDRVFEPFYSTKPDRGGLGLAIAWRTAAAHGGRLSIESAVGRGTVVQVALPRAEAGNAYLLEQ